jgi:hypothetical protein
MKWKKFVVGAGLAGLLAFGVSNISPVVAQSQSENNQQSANAMSATGKVSAIGSDHKSFSLQTSGGDTMQFVLNQNTQVQGRVSTGTTATVQYQKTDDGKLLATVIAPQDSGENNNGRPQ